MKKKKLFIACLTFFLAGFTLSVLAAPPLSATTLYAGTSNPGMVYKYDGSTWTAISGSLGFGVMDIIEFKGNLYAATMSYLPYSGVGKIWRYDGGTSWTVVTDYLDHYVCDLEVWDGKLYAGTAWSGGKLYRYNETTDTFDYLGTVPDYDSGGHYHHWGGIRALYPSSLTGDLHLGDIGYDCLGRWDGTDLIHDAYMGGSCIYDFADFDGEIYAAAWAGRLLWSSTGIGLTWSDQYFSGYYIWELEVFQGLLYSGNYGGNLRSLDPSHTVVDVWASSSGGPYEQICSMVADGDSVLYFGTGGEAGYIRYDIGTAKVYSYDGSSTPVEIFDADGGDTGSTDHAGIQCLYIPPCIYVDIDIKPGSCPNSINLGSNGNVPVAIFSTEDFDATTIDPTTVTLAGATVKIKGKGTPMSSFEDVDGDGLLDIVVHVDTSALELAAGDTDAILEGETFDGVKIRGTDTVRIVQE